MKPKLLGDYEIGYESVRLYVREGTGAEFYRQSADVNCPTVYVGLEAPQWHMIVARVLHEVLELTLDRLFCRFYPSRDLSADTGAYVFMLDHRQFSTVCADVAEFLCAALPDLEEEYRKQQ